MRGCSGGRVWLSRGGMRGCSGERAWLLGGGHVVALGGHVWLLWGGGMHGCYGGVCGFCQGGVRGFSRGACVGYDEIRSMSGRYASYWNAFLLIEYFRGIFPIHEYFCNDILK